MLFFLDEAEERVAEDRRGAVLVEDGCRVEDADLGVEDFALDGLRVREREVPGACAARLRDADWRDLRGGRNGAILLGLLT
ncbi:MAG: hypothetical protein D6704_09395 [Nitrospirae bacterium]|nr:MAG: hypothetical protein D6704_09395 [Nitrospirota bacterium]